MSHSVESTTDRVSLYKQLFGIDVRGLAVFRIALAMLIIGDLVCFRWPNVEVFFSDAGILPRQMSETLVGPGYWTLYGFDGSVLNSKVLIVLNGVLAFGLLVGWRTRSMTLACLVLAWSIQMRNPLVLSGGDVVLRMLLWWGVFLPLGAKWSLDAALRVRKRPAKYLPCSVATAAILVQVAIVYLFAGLAKLNPDWLQGSAVQQALQLEMYTKPFGDWLSRMSGILYVANYSVLILELLGPFVLFIPWRTNKTRLFLMVAFCGMHIGIWLTMSIGIFSLAMMVAWVLFLPTEVWDRCCGVFRDFGNDLPEDFPILKKIGDGICGVALLFCLAINIAQTFDSKPIWYQNGGELFAKTCMLVQEFNLWGHPPKTNPTFQFQAQIEQGGTRQVVDLLSFYLHSRLERPESEYQYLHSQPWRRFFWEMRLNKPEYLKVRQKFEEFLVAQCRNRLPDSNVRLIDAGWGQEKSLPEKQEGRVFDTIH